MNCIILGNNSEIAKGLEDHLVDDGWHVSGWNRKTPINYLRNNFPEWDLVICAIGTVAPVGNWYSVPGEVWAHAVVSNCTLPVSLLRECFHLHKPNASVCFLAGANPNRAGPNYSGYYTGKMALLKAIETMDAETPEVKMFALAPGIVFTKIHQPTYDSGIINQGLEERRSKGGTPIANIYDCLRWCMSMPKEVIGGRNICVSDGHGPELAARLQMNPALFKLRRVE